MLTSHFRYNVHCCSSKLVYTINSGRVRITSSFGNSNVRATAARHIFNTDHYSCFENRFVCVDLSFGTVNDAVQLIAPFELNF